VPGEIMKEIEERTTTVEDFIAECLKLDIEYEDIFEYLKTTHKG
jgi:DNA-binding transcriptional regulator YhcF (GntR family)